MEITKPYKRHQLGVTIIELVVSIVVLATIIALAVPSFSDFINSNRVTTAANEIVASLQLARSEATKRNGAVLVQSSNGTTDWSGGHRIGIDLNGDGDLLDTVSGVVELLRDVDPPHDVVTLTNDSLSELSFGPIGEVTTTSSFSVDASRGDVCTRTISVSLQGTTSLSIQSRPCT